MKRTAARYLFATSTALLLAGSITIPTVASAASFTDIQGNAHETAITHVVEKGLVSGYPDGTFKPNQGLTNSDVVKFMGRYLLESGYDIPKDYKMTSRFTDLSLTADDTLLGFAALLKDEEIFPGEGGQLNPTELITREEMATVLVHTMSKIHDFDFTTYVNGQSFPVEVMDLEEASETAQPAIRVLDFYNLTNVAQFNPKTTLTRGQFATFLDRSTDVKVPELTAQTFDSFIVKGDDVLPIDIWVTSPKIQGDLEFDVYGLIDDEEVLIPNEDGQAYSVATKSRFLTVNGTKVRANVEAIRKAYILEKENDRFKVEIFVTMNDTGEQLTHKFMLARNDADALNIKFHLADRQLDYKQSLKNMTINVSDTTNQSLQTSDLFKEILKAGYFEIEDAYGNTPKEFNKETGTVIFRDGTKQSIKLTVSEIDSKNAENAIIANGTNQISIKLGEEGLTEGDAFTLTLALAGTEKPVRVYLD